MSYPADRLKEWMDQRGLSAATVASALGTEEQTIRKWRSQGVPDRRKPHVERFMAEWIDPDSAQSKDTDTSTLRIEFDDQELDEVSQAARIVDTPIRDFIRRAAVHQARVHIDDQPKTRKAPASKKATPLVSVKSRSTKKQASA